MDSPLAFEFKCWMLHETVIGSCFSPLFTDLLLGFLLAIFFYFIYLFYVLIFFVTAFLFPKCLIPFCHLLELIGRRYSYLKKRGSLTMTIVGLQTSFCVLFIIIFCMLFIGVQKD